MLELSDVFGAKHLLKACDHRLLTAYAWRTLDDPSGIQKPHALDCRDEEKD
jgi:hypothetical protein